MAFILIMPNNKKNSVKFIVDNFLSKKEGKKIFKNLGKLNLLKSGIIDSLDVFTLAAMIEKKSKRKINLSSKKVLKKFEKYNKI